LTLDLYPGSESTSYVLYEDDGVSLAYLGGAYATTKLALDATGARPAITIGPQTIAKHDFAGRLCARTYVLKVNGQAAEPKAVTRDGAAVPAVAASAFEGAAEGWYYDDAAKTVWVKFRLEASAGTNVSL